ncbi:hypothetical protein AAEK94_004478 [Salmonella enterica]
MITKEQATYLMKLVHDIDDASEAMSYTAGDDHDAHEESSKEWTYCYRELKAFVDSITEPN